MRPASLRHDRFLLLRTICVVAIAIAFALAATVNAKSLEKIGFLTEPGAVVAIDEPGHVVDSSRSNGRCAPSGLCWILPNRTAGLPARLIEEASHAVPIKVVAKAKWSSGPPDQPPRRSM